MSNRLLRLPVAFLIVAVITVFGLRAVADPTPARAPGPVVVVDLFRVLEEAQPFVAERESIRRWIDEQKRTNLTVKKDEIAAKEAELEMFQAGTEPYRKRRNEAEFAKLVFQQEFEHLEEIRLQRILTAQRAAYRKAREAIGEVAARHGARAALQLRSHELTGRDEQQLASEMFVRDVLWHDGSLDITTDVIRILDAPR